MPVHSDLTPHFTIEDGQYFTIYGPLFYNHALNFPGAGALECRGSLTSLLQVRKPEIMGYHDKLFTSQGGAIRNLRVPLHKLRLHLVSHFDCDDVDTAHMRWLLAPHIKRRLRLTTHADYVDKGLEPDEKGYVTFKMKNGEHLPAGKKRGICDVGTLRTNLTGFVIDNLKDALAVPFEYNGCVYRFIKTADRDGISGLFNEVIHGGRDIYAVHGDDSIGSFECLDGRINFNADISKCDGSHGRSVVYKLRSMLSKILAGTGHLEYVNYAFDILSKDLHFANPKNRKQYVKYRFTQPRLYSGSVLTTLLNSFANFLIGLHVQSQPKVLKADFAAHFSRCAAEVGYIVTIQMCEAPEHLQFLKMSPHQTLTGKFVAVNNLGSCLKSFGIFNGDLPGRGDLVERARKHNFEVVLGRVDWGNHIIAQAFVTCVQRMTRVHHGADMLNKSDEIRIESLCIRYGCQVDDFIELAALIRQATVGSIVVHPLVDIMYAVDYG